MRSENHIIHALGGIGLTQGEVETRLETLQGVVLGIKVHPAFITHMFAKRHYNVARAIKDAGFKLMIDDKSHDIETEIVDFVHMYEDLGMDILSVHASGGKSMLELAKRAARTTKIFGVSLLTSFTEEETLRVYRTGVRQTIVRLFRIIEEADCHGSVSAPRDLAWLKSAMVDPSSRTRMCPNIRHPQERLTMDDQNMNRSMTPEQAGRAGVDIMVIGRPISLSKNPQETALKFERQFRRGLKARTQ